VGNLPSNRPYILEVLRNARKNGITIVNVSQCRKGLVGESSYSGNLLESLGVINALDMTVECALAKLSYLLGKVKFKFFILISSS
jgi:lysophospholipase